MSIQMNQAWTLGCAWLLAAMSAQASYINHNFDAAPFVNGANFLAPGISNWVASTSSVIVVNNKSVSGPQSVYLPEGSAISNAVSQSSPTTAWTDLRLAPMLGAAPSDTSAATNGASFVCYLASNGYVTVWGGSGWLTCSNDVWGGAVTKVTNGVFATLSIYQNYTSKRLALMVDDRVVAQDLPFPAPNANYDYVVVQNAASNAWLDDAWVQTGVETSRHTNNINNAYEPLADATELQTHGYVARTFYVGATPPYTNLTAALAVARDRDRIVVDCGAVAYTDSATITANVTIAGCTFTNAGTLTVQAGKTVTVENGFTSPLIVEGTLALAGGVTVNGSLVTVAGSGLITGLVATAQLLAGNLDITGSGQVAVTGGRVSDTGAMVDMTGTFTLTSTWDSPAITTLDFTENFERYADNTRLDKLGFAGWGASAASALVQAGKGYTNSMGALVAEGSLISNRLSTTGQAKIWTDFRLRPMPGNLPASADTNNTGFVCYVASNGLLNVWQGTAGAWLVCSNYVNGSGVAAMTTNSYPRVTVFANFTSKKTAVFVDGKLSRELISFPLNTLLSYSSFQAQNSDGSAWFDDLRITTVIPSDLQAVNANTDLDGDGTADAAELQLNDSVLVWNGPRTLFLFQ